MSPTPQFLAARAKEQRLRDLAHLRALCYLPLFRAGAVFTHAPLVPLTTRHRLELRVAGNAFFHPAPILRGDVFLFLWRLHPLHRAPLFGRAWALRGLERRIFPLLSLWYALGSLRAACIHRALTRAVRTCDLAAATDSIFSYLAATEQDAPAAAYEPGGSHRSGPLAPPRHGADNHVDYLMTAYRLTEAQALDFPVALGHQLYRERLLQQPEGELAVFAPSDELLSL